MADNYLEKRYEEVFGKGQAGPKGTQSRHPGIENLLMKNRSHRAYDSSYEVKLIQLEAIVRVNTLIPSAMNRQCLRFKLLTKENGVEKIRPFYRLGGSLNFPPEGQEPNAFIIVCSCIEPDHYVHIDLGISAQSMLLKAAEMGLNGVMVGNFDKKGVQTAFGLEMEPLLLIPIGKGVEKIELESIGARDNHHYWRENGVHHVPKVRLEDLLIH